MVTVVFNRQALSLMSTLCGEGGVRVVNETVRFLVFPVACASEVAG